MSEQPQVIEVRGARVHNLADIDVDIPLGKLVAVAGVSGSGKSSLALGVVYAEGSRRYLEALSTYTRRRLTQASRPAVDSVKHVPAALALRQRPGQAGIRSTFGTSTELLNALRLLFSRIGSQTCPNGHHVAPTSNVAREHEIVCPVCDARFFGLGAEALAFNSAGACPGCSGTGTVRLVDDTTLVPDESLSIEAGAVLPWQLFGLRVMGQVAQALGVRTDVPFSRLSDRERDLVFAGEAVSREVTVPSKSGKVFQFNAVYHNAHDTVVEALHKAKTDKGLNRINRFLSVQTCPDCHGTRLNERVRAIDVDGYDLAQVGAWPLARTAAWIRDLPQRLFGGSDADTASTAPRPAAEELPGLRAMAAGIGGQFLDTAGMLMDLGLGYLGLDRAQSTLSTGERQRAELARAVRNETTGVLYVLDEPSIGMHPSNIRGLLEVIRRLLADGNSVIVVDHDVQVLREADWLLEIGPGSGSEGGRVVAQGPLDQMLCEERSRIAPFIRAEAPERVRTHVPAAEVFAHGSLSLGTAPVHTVHALDVEVPIGRLTAVTGVSGSGKTTLVLESLVPALRAADGGLPEHVTHIDPAGIKRVNVVDASPIGVNVRSTVATYSGVMDELRRAYAKTPAAKAAGLKAGAFSYNTGELRCSECDGTGQTSLDVQFLPDIDMECAVCHGSRYGARANGVCLELAAGDGGASAEPGAALTLPQVLGLSVREAAAALRGTPGLKKAARVLETLVELGLGYLTLGEATTALSGGEAQRLKLAGEVGRDQSDALFVFDEPSIGLHPLDVQTLLRVLQRLIDGGATVVVIEHDLDVIANADHLIDMGPGGGADGGRIVATGTPEQLAAGAKSTDAAGESVTAKYLSA
jgi:excinuclease ABC subunit A